MMPRIALAILMAVCVAAPAVAFDATRLQPSEISVDPNATAQSLRDLTITKEDWQYLLANMPADLKAQGGLARITKTQTWYQATKNYYCPSGTCRVVSAMGTKGAASLQPIACNIGYAPTAPAAPAGYRLMSRAVTADSMHSVSTYDSLYYYRTCSAQLIYDYVTN